MNSLVKRDASQNEKKINWLEDLNDCPWVRESSIDFINKQGISQKRRSEIEREGKKLIGYAELEEDAPPSFVDKATGRKYYERRIFTVRRDDYENYKNNYPTEAVDPLTVEAKVLGSSPKKKRR